jgi:hypothetical protein
MKGRRLAVHVEAEEQVVDQAVLDVVVGRVPGRGLGAVVGQGAVALERGEAAAVLRVEEVAPVEALRAREPPQALRVAVEGVQAQVEEGAVDVDPPLRPGVGWGAGGRRCTWSSQQPCSSF